MSISYNSASANQGPSPAPCLVAVVSTTQTYVEALKKSNQFNTENQKIAFQMSYDTAVSIMTQEAKDFIATAYGSLNGWLTAQIEAAVNLNK